MTFDWRSKSYALLGIKDIINDGCSICRIINLGSLLRQTPFANTLSRYLKSGVRSTGREIFILEDIVDIRIERNSEVFFFHLTFLCCCHISQSPIFGIVGFFLLSHKVERFLLRHKPCLVNFKSLLFVCRTFYLNKLTVAKTYSPYHSEWLTELLGDCHLSLSVLLLIPIYNIRCRYRSRIPHLREAWLQNTSAIHSIGTNTKQAVDNSTG